MERVRVCWVRQQEDMAPALKVLTAQRRGRRWLRSADKAAIQAAQDALRSACLLSKSSRGSLPKALPAQIKSVIFFLKHTPSLHLSVLLGTPTAT